jgi:hypothetical protein
MSNFKLPKFANEDEEAKWWYENRELISEEFQKAAKEGRLKRGGIRRLFAEKGIPFREPQNATAPTPTTTIRLDLDDIALARTQAEKRGLRYQTYLKMIIHEALRKVEEENKPAAA